MSLASHITKVFHVYKPQRKWTTIYWMVDVHGVIIPGSWHRENTFVFMNTFAEAVLRWISKEPDQRLILWTSSYKSETDALREWLEKKEIHVDYINENPEEEHTTYADFSKKPYFNILLDDKAGFDPETDWEVIYQLLWNPEFWRETT